MKPDSFQSITSSAKRFFTGTLLSRLSGMIREVLMAAFFGADPAVASFLMAFRFSNFFRRFLGEGAFQSSFIPHFESLRKNSPAQAFSFFKQLSRSVTLFLLLLILLIEIPLLIFPHFLPCSQGVRQILLFSALMLPGILFISLFTLNSAILQCEKNYFTPGFAPVLFNLTWIIALFFISGYLPSKAMFWLTFAILAAYFLQWLFTLPKMHQILSSQEKCEKIPFSQNFQNLKKTLFTSMIGVGAVQINSTLDFIFCRISTETGPIFLSFAFRLYQLPLALFGISLAGALLPPLSRAVQHKEDAGYRSFLNSTLRQAILASVFATAAILLFALPAVHLIYGRGAFSSDATWNTALTLAAYGTGFLPAVLLLILASAFYAKGNFKIPVRASTSSIIANLALNSLFIFFFHWQAGGVALATSLSSLLNLLVLLHGLKQENIQIDWASQFMVFLKAILIALLSAIAASYFLPFSLDEMLFIKKTALLPNSFYGQCKLMFIPFTIYLSSFLLGTYLMKMKEVLTARRVSDS